jgi:DNA-binding transcriptional MerR regulator
MAELPEDDVDRVKMSVLARRSGVPAATIKHYVREGLLPEPFRTSRNMAYYDASLVPRIQAIKELQRTRFLPLRVIKGILEQAEDSGLELADVVQRVLDSHAEQDFRSRDAVLEAGVPKAQLVFFEKLGLVRPEEHEGEVGYRGDDLALLRILGTARRAGITPEMLPHTILQPYVKAVYDLAKLELELFEQGVAPSASGNLPALVEVASELSERLVVVLRRKMLQQILASRRTSTRDSSPPPTEATAAKSANDEPKAKGRRAKT